MVTLLSYTRRIFYAAVEGVSLDSGQNIPLQSLIWGKNIFLGWTFIFFFFGQMVTIQYNTNDKKHVVVKAVPSTLEEHFINCLEDVGLKICIVKKC